MSWSSATMARSRASSRSALGNGHSFYNRMSRPFFHTLIVRSDLLIVHETTNSPFRPQAVFADFAPEESEPAKAAAYQADLIGRVDALLRG
jgi:hypothetical protein